MKKILLVIMLVIMTFAYTSPVLAADTTEGAKVFTANCAACHLGGRNVIAAAKTLKKDALEANKMDSIEAITTQVQNGKNAMPAFKNRLNDEQIEAVATYVLDRANQDWS